MDNPVDNLACDHAWYRVEVRPWWRLWRRRVEQRCYRCDVAIIDPDGKARIIVRF